MAATPPRQVDADAFMDDSDDEDEELLQTQDEEQSVDYSEESEEGSYDDDSHDDSLASGDPAMLRLTYFSACFVMLCLLVTPTFHDLQRLSEVHSHRQGILNAALSTIDAAKLATEASSFEEALWRHVVTGSGSAAETAAINTRIASLESLTKRYVDGTHNLPSVPIDFSTLRTEFANRMPILATAEALSLARRQSLTERQPARSAVLTHLLSSSAQEALTALVVLLPEVIPNRAYNDTNVTELWAADVRTNATAAAAGMGQLAVQYVAKDGTFEVPLGELPVLADTRGSLVVVKTAIELLANASNGLSTDPMMTSERMRFYGNATGVQLIAAVATLQSGIDAFVAAGESLSAPSSAAPTGLSTSTALLKDVTAAFRRFPTEVEDLALLTRAKDAESLVHGIQLEAENAIGKDAAFMAKVVASVCMCPALIVLVMLFQGIGGSQVPSFLRYGRFVTTAVILVGGCAAITAVVTQTTIRVAEDSLPLTSTNASLLDDMADNVFIASTTVRNATATLLGIDGYPLLPGANISAGARQLGPVAYWECTSAVASMALPQSLDLRGALADSLLGDSASTTNAAIRSGASSNSTLCAAAVAVSPLLAAASVLRQDELAAGSLSSSTSTAADDLHFLRWSEIRKDATSCGSVSIPLSDALEVLYRPVQLTSCETPTTPLTSFFGPGSTAASFVNANATAAMEDARQAYLRLSTSERGRFERERRFIVWLTVIGGLALQAIAYLVYLSLAGVTPIELLQ